MEEPQTDTISSICCLSLIRMFPAIMLLIGIDDDKDEMYSDYHIIGTDYFDNESWSDDDFGSDWICYIVLIMMIMMMVISLISDDHRPGHKSNVSDYVDNSNRNFERVLILTATFISSSKATKRFAPWWHSGSTRNPRCHHDTLLFQTTGKRRGRIQQGCWYLVIDNGRNISMHYVDVMIL